MCGVCGVVVHDPSALPGPDALRAMRDVLTHRGPDGAGETHVASVPTVSAAGWLGHRRLKILDLSDHAHQPMASDDGLVALTYNGEVYNYRQLRTELEALGHRFTSTGDTEVVLRAYEAWGTGAFARLDGMFALGIWDGRLGRLLLARDRTGKKPLYVYAQDDRIAFASEIKGLLQVPWVPRRPAQDQVAKFLVFGYVPTPATLLHGITQVPTASWMAFDGQGAHDPVSYWSPFGHGSRVLPTRTGLHGVAERIEAAVERRLVADVPVGALLSGGIDSSVVVGLTAKLSPEPVHTFSIGFPEDPSFDERDPARRVAAHFGTRHTEFAVELDAVALLDRLLWHHDQPFHDSSAVPTYVVSRLAREHVSVVLTGDGGDEVFGGYDRFTAAALAIGLPAPAARALLSLLRLLPRHRGYFSARRRAERFLELADRGVEERYQGWISVFAPETVDSVVAGSIGPDLLDSMADAYAEAGERRPLDRILHANFRTYLPDDLAVKMDRMSMAHSLEARSPLLDTDVIEYAARIPARLKVGIRRPKPVLRWALRSLVPEFVWQRRKHGFGVPMNAWFDGELGGMFADEVLAADSRVADYLCVPELERMLAAHRSGEESHGPRLWTVLTMERWLRSIESPPSVTPPAAGRDPILDADETLMRGAP